MEFHQTAAGKRFFESDFTRLVKVLERIATALEKQNEFKETERKLIKKEQIKEARKRFIHDVKNLQINESTSTDKEISGN